jgi:hypothetical protein
MRYLRENADRLPAGARHFALAEWYFNREHSQCPHDSWLEELRLTEQASGQRRQIRSLLITARFLGAYHDGQFELVYKDVVKYSLQHVSDSKTVAHGDWLFDELTIDGDGVLRHEIRFWKATWTIHCFDLSYQWIPIPGRSR